MKTEKMVISQMVTSQGALSAWSHFPQNSRKEVLALGRVAGCSASVSLTVIFK